MSLLANYYWKKAAAQVTDDGAVERAFMDQAYGFLANKAGKLMQDQHRLGFEVVYKNDSNTRMVGIFAFRINDQLLYAPVFFLNGEIKGTDLLYRQETKTFVPLNEEWVSFLTEKSNYEAGTAIDKEHYSRTNNHVRFEDIAYPPASAGKKRASELTTTEAVLKDVIENEMVTELTTLNKQAGELIHKFIVEDGGNDAVAKIASLMESNFKFAEALVSNIQESDYLPTDIPAVKSASAPEPKLVLFTGALGTTPHSYLLKGATDAYAKGFFSKGYYLWDDRAESEIVPVYKDGTEQLEMVGSAGMYDVLMRDGSFRKAIVAPLSKENVKGYGPVSCDSGYSYYGDGPYDHARSYRDTYTPHVVCMLDGKKESDTENKVYGKFLKDQAAMIRDDDLSNKVKADQAYRIYDAEAGTISEPMYILSTKTTDGVHQYSFIPMYGGSNPQTITHNPDVPENDLPGNFVGAAAYFIPIATERMKKDTNTSFDGKPYYSFYHEHIATPGIGCSDTMKQWALEHVKQASILFDDASNTFSWKTGYKDQSPYMSRMEFATKLASAGVHADTVEDMLDETVKSGSTSWYYGDPEMHKEAFPMRLTHQPVFRTENNTEFSVNQESPQSFMIGIQDNSIQKPGQKIGDAYDPGMGRKPEDGMHKDMLLKMQPDQIAQYASANELPNVFEHGLVGSLVQVYDSISMIDKYLPDMEEALDRLGRILFLFYWKPRDFEDAYGTDDMTNLENQILSNFKSFGSLVLDLTKRSKKRQTGSVSLGTN